MIKAGHTYELSQLRVISYQTEPPSDRGSQQIDYEMVDWIPTDYDLESVTIKMRMCANLIINDKLQRIPLGTVLRELDEVDYSDYYWIQFHYVTATFRDSVHFDSMSCIPTFVDEYTIDLTARIPVTSSYSRDGKVYTLKELIANPASDAFLICHPSYYVGKPSRYDPMWSKNDEWKYGGVCYGVWMTVKYDLPNSMARYNGTEWERCLVNRYDGTKWEQCLHFYYDGTKWIPCSSL